MVVLRFIFYPVCVLQVRVSVPSICVQTSNLASNSGIIDASFENRNLVLSASRASGPPPSDPQAPTSHPPGDPPAAQEQLCAVTLASGGAHLGIGLADKPVAASVNVSGVSVDLHLLKAEPKLAIATADSQTAAVVQVHGEANGLAANCCPVTLWPMIDAVQQLQQQQQRHLQEQLLQQQGLHLPDAPKQPPQLQQQLQQQGAGLPMQTLLPQYQHTADEASSMHSPVLTESVPAAADADSARMTNTEAAAAAEQAAVEKVEAVKPAVVSLQWEVALQVSSSSQLEVVGDNGTVLLSSAVEAVTLRAASGDGSTMRARSFFDAVFQLSCQASSLSLWSYPRVFQLKCPASCHSFTGSGISAVMSGKTPQP